MKNILFVDSDLCTACLLCAQVLPGVFRMNDENKAEVQDQDGATEEQIEEIVQACPVGAIKFRQQPTVIPRP